MAKERLTPQDLDARLKFILGITLGSILFITAVGIMYALIFVTQPITGQSENDKMFFNVLGSVATFITGTLAGLLIGRSGSDAIAASVKETAVEPTPVVSEVSEVKAVVEDVPAAKLDDPNYN
jgi:branched-subunit amino acid ABC-type transport system permease component